MPTLRELAEQHVDRLAHGSQNQYQRRVTIAMTKLFRRMRRLKIEIEISPENALRILACEALPGPVAESTSADALWHQEARRVQREARAEKRKKRQK